MFGAFRVGRWLMEVESKCPRLFSNREIRLVGDFVQSAFVCIAVVAGGFGIGFVSGEGGAIPRPVRSTAPPGRVRFGLSGG